MPGEVYTHGDRIAFYCRGKAGIKGARDHAVPFSPCTRQATLAFEAEINDRIVEIMAVAREADIAPNLQLKLTVQE